MDDDWPAVVGYLRKARQKWAQLASILGLEGAYSRTSGKFYMDLMQETLLFGFDIWVMIPCTVQTLEMFHQCR